jgi:hypothetical protein
VTVVLVSVGVRVTADSVCVVVVAVGSFTTVVQEEKSIAQAGMTRSNKDNFFIIVLLLTKPIRLTALCRMAESRFF